MTNFLVFVVIIEPTVSNFQIFKNKAIQFPTAKHRNIKAQNKPSSVTVSGSVLESALIAFDIRKPEVGLSAPPKKAPRAPKKHSHLLSFNKENKRPLSTFTSFASSNFLIEFLHQYLIGIYLFYVTFS